MNENKQTGRNKLVPDVHTPIKKLVDTQQIKLSLKRVSIYRLTRKDSHKAGSLSNVIEI